VSRGARAAIGALVGFGVGAAVGGVLVLSKWPRGAVPAEERAKRMAIAISEGLNAGAFAAIAGAAIGALVGALTAPR